MSRLEWPRDDLVALVEGKRIMMRGPEAGDLPVPGWLAAVASEVSAHDSSESLELTHPDDRGTLIEAFIGSLDSPRVPVTCRIRVDLDGQWRHSDVVWLNLLDHEVGGVLCTVEDHDGPAIEPPATSGVASIHAATNWMILILGERGEVLGARGSLREILGYELDEIAGRVATDFVHPECLSGAVENWIELRQHPGQTRTSRQMWTRADGTSIWLETSFLLHDDGSVEVVILDISDRIANEQALAASQAEVAALAEDFRLVADEVPTPVFRCDVQGGIDFRNAQWSESFPDHADVEHLQEILHTDDREAFDDLVSSVVGDVGGSQVVEARAADGLRMLSVRCRAVGDAASLRLVGSISDITATVNLRHQATHDDLTGLANRAMITAHAAEAAREDPAGTLVVFVDLDGFKSVNDTYGHDVGDVVLVEVARRLTAAVRPGDMVGRYGGDEFVMVCRGVTETGVATILDRLRGEVFCRPIELPVGSSWQPDASMGHARPERGADVAAVLRQADRAMFEAKRARHGRTRQPT